LLYLDPDYKIIRELLIKYYYSRANWDDFIAAQKVTREIRETLAKLRVELKRHGYAIYGAVNGKLQHCYLTDTAEKHRGTIYQAPPVTPCDLCERECSRKDMNGVHRKGDKRCWETDSEQPGEGGE